MCILLVLGSVFAWQGVNLLDGKQHMAAAISALASSSVSLPTMLESGNGGAVSGEEYRVPGPGQGTVSSSSSAAALYPPPVMGFSTNAAVDAPASEARADDPYGVCLSLSIICCRHLAMPDSDHKRIVFLLLQAIMLPPVCTLTS